MADTATKVENPVLAVNQQTDVGIMNQVRQMQFLLFIHLQNMHPDAKVWCAEQLQIMAKYIVESMRKETTA